VSSAIRTAVSRDEGLAEIFTYLSDMLPPSVLDSHCGPSFLALAAQVYRYGDFINHACPDDDSWLTQDCVDSITSLGIPATFQRSSGIDFYAIVPPTEPATEPATEPLTEPVPEEVNSAASTSVFMVLVALESLMYLLLNIYP
jgi:hypothetical protein